MDDERAFRDALRAELDGTRDFIMGELARAAPWLVARPRRRIRRRGRWVSRRDRRAP